MKKAMKITGKILLGILILLLAFLLVMFIYHRIMLSKEKPLLEPLGQMVEVDGHNMSIYTEGEGEHTIVFLSGYGTASPILDFKPLYSRLSDENRIAVVEKFGYGFSDEIDGERDMDTILRQDREALQKAGIEAPYVLCPHSFSGYEATLWAQKCPEEVEAIVGLDICTPNCKDKSTLTAEHDSMKKILPIYRFLQYTGGLRIFNEDESGTLTAEEKQIYTELNCKKSLNDTVIREGSNDLELALYDEFDASPLPTVPMIMYVSADNDGDELWVGGMQAMVDASENGQLIKLDCGHYVHNFEYERISANIKELIAELNSRS